MLTLVVEVEVQVKSLVQVELVVMEFQVILQVHVSLMVEVVAVEKEQLLDVVLLEDQMVVVKVV